MGEGLLSFGLAQAFWEDGEETIAKFSSLQRLHWCYTDPPTHGAVQVADSGNSNVKHVSYSPASFFPSTDAGSVAITWEGYLDNPNNNGALTSLGWCWPPYAEDTKTLTIYKP